jgi:chemotaxis protein CheC
MMLEMSGLNDSQLDFFRELENIGAGNAATALAEIFDRRIEMRYPRVQLCGLDKVTGLLHGAESPVVGLLVNISGDLNGFILLLLSVEEARRMAKMATGRTDEAGPDPGEWFDDMDFSAITEIANILVGSYVTAIAGLTALNIVPSVPELVIDMAGAVMGVPAIAYGQYSDTVLFLETEFIDSSGSVTSHFFLIPEVASYLLLMKKMGID